MSGLDEVPVRLAVMTVIVHALIARAPKQRPVDTVANDLAATARIVADALLEEAKR